MKCEKSVKLIYGTYSLGHNQIIIDYFENNSLVVDCVYEYDLSDEILNVEPGKKYGIYIVIKDSEIGFGENKVSCWYFPESKKRLAINKMLNLMKRF